MAFIPHTLLPAAASAVLAAGCLLATPHAARATVVYDNLASSQDGSDAVFGSGPLAQSFNTGASGGALGGIDLLLMSGSSAFAGSVQVSLLADSGTSPGATLVSLGSLANSAISTSLPTAYDFAPVSSIVLDANTTYWVEISESTPSAIEWGWSLDTSALGVAGQFADSAAFGINAVDGFGAYQMSVQVPEPASVAVLLGGLLGLAGMRRSRKG